MDIVSTGATTTDEASLVTNCAGLIPLYAASTLAPVTVAQLPAGTSIEVVVKTQSGIPKGIVLGL